VDEDQMEVDEHFQSTSHQETHLLPISRDKSKKDLRHTRKDVLESELENGDANDFDQSITYLCEQKSMRGMKVQSKSSRTNVPAQRYTNGTKQKKRWNTSMSKRIWL